MDNISRSNDKVEPCMKQVYFAGIVDTTLLIKD